MISDLLDDLQLPKSSKLLKNFIEYYLRYMVSYKRMSRIEVIKALSSLLEEKEEMDNNLNRSD
jgi:hypothetical protein